MRHLACCLTFLTCVVLGAPVAGATNTHYPFGSDFRHCGPVRGGAIHVSAKKLACPRAKRVVREFYFGPERRKRHHGPESYNGWWTLKRFPGWRCTEGTGGGGCRKHGHEAAFSTL